MAGALEGLRVLDGSQMMAGPLCCIRLGDLGAEVLKIEPPGTGDWTRAHGFANAAIEGETTAWLGLNRNKKSVTINLKNPEGREVFYDLVRKSDVYIQNYRVGTAERLGAGYEHLSEINPRLVYASISGFGEQGPYKQRPGQDLVIQAYSGSMWAVGSKNDLPLPGSLWAADAMAAYQAAIGILAALWSRESTGKGQKIEVNMLAVTMDAQIQEITTYLNLGIKPERSEEWSAHAFIPAPYGVYKTADGYIVLAMTPIHVLGEAVDNDRLRELTDWSDGVTHRDEIYRIVRAILPTRTSAEWIEIFDRYNVWTGPVYDYEDLANDPHINQTGMITSVQHPTIGDLKMPNVPMKMSGTPAEVRLPPPLLGEHTDAVLHELLGYNKERLQALHASGAI
jgi:crotonobetainyl-CoA:carnitine CoA-transferase CaiB-like acyl-CoA transferase